MNTIFNVGDSVRWNVGTKRNPIISQDEVVEVYPNGSVELSGGHTFDKDGLHYDMSSRSTMVDGYGNRVKLVIVEPANKVLC